MEVVPNVYNASLQMAWHARVAVYVSVSRRNCQRQVQPTIAAHAILGVWLVVQARFAAGRCTVQLVLRAPSQCLSPVAACRAASHQARNTAACTFQACGVAISVMCTAGRCTLNCAAGANATHLLKSCYELNGWNLKIDGSAI